MIALSNATARVSAQADTTGRATAQDGITVLLAEDDDVDALAVQRAFRQLKIGNRMIRARDGIEALELLRTPGAVPRPNILLVDINMPGMNGLELLNAVRGDPDLASSVVFILTTSHNENDVKVAYDRHVAGYVVKREGRDGLPGIVAMLDHYWQVVELPR